MQVRKLIVGQKGFLSTPAVSCLIRKREINGELFYLPSAAQSQSRRTHLLQTASRVALTLAQEYELLRLIALCTSVLTSRKSVHTSNSNMQFLSVGHLRMQNRATLLCNCSSFAIEWNPPTYAKCVYACAYVRALVRVSVCTRAHMNVRACVSPVVLTR